MKFSINRDLLFTELNHASKGLSTKTPMPILTGIKLVASKSGLKIITSNMDISIQIEIPISDQLIIEETGDCVVPGKYFVDIIRKIDAKMVDFSIFEENTIKILADRSNFTLIAMDKNNFPNFQFVGTPNPIILTSQKLKQIIKQTSFAAGISETRIILTGVCLEINENSLKAVATDSYRLARKELTMEHEAQSNQVVIPSRSLDELNKIIDDTSENIEVHLLTNKVLFKYKNIYFLTRLIEGSFPDTSSLIPSEFLLEMVFNKNDLLATIDRVSLFATMDTTNIIKLSLNPNQTIELSSTSTEIGKAVEEIIPLSCTEIKQFQIAFSSKYFYDALKAFESDKIKVQFTGEIKPFIITGDKDPELTQLILPVRVS
ncbi:MAG TPA: DNA polymerase III subunit beta [Acholeplasmataceae bacterium]|nr:DNA polymerase III subunit beta [Acholeplasmataceae bacterium]